MKKILKVISDEKSVFTIGKLIYTVGTFIFTLVAAKLLGPDKMGSWNIIALIFTYGTFVHLGILNGLGREIPFFLARDNISEIEKIMTQSFWYLVLIGCILLGLGTFLVLMDNSESLVGLGLFVLIFSLFYSYAFIVIRSFQKFYLLGMAHFMMSFSIFSSLAIFYFYPSLINFAFSYIVWMFVGFLFITPYIKFISFKWDDFRQLYLLIRIGFPIFLVGFIYMMFNSIDRVIIINLLGIDYLGLYTPAITATGIILIAPSIVSTITYPKLVYLYGKSETLESLIFFVKKVVMVNFLTTIIVCSVAYFMYKYVFIPYFLFDYTEGILAMNIILFASIFLPIGLSFGDFFNAVGLQKKYLRNILLGLLVNIFVGYIMVVYFRLALTGIALGTLSGYLVFTLLQLNTFYSVRKNVKYA